MYNNDTIQSGLTNKQENSKREGERNKLVSVTEESMNDGKSPHQCNCEEPFGSQMSAYLICDYTIENNDYRQNVNYTNPCNLI